MLAKTHMAIGISAALAVMNPESALTALPIMTAAAVGAVISDIDAEHSFARKNADRLLNGCVLIVVGMILLKQLLRVDLFAYIKSNTKLSTQLFGCAVFGIYCNIGKKTAHRSMMHSFVSAILLSGCVSFSVSPMMGIAFLCGFLSHLVLDLLNYKGEQLFWPLPNKLCLGLCTSNRWVNDILEIIGVIMAVLLFLRCLGIHVFLEGVLPVPDFHAISSCNLSRLVL